MATTRKTPARSTAKSGTGTKRAAPRKPSAKPRAETRARAKPAPAAAKRASGLGALSVGALVAAAGAAAYGLFRLVTRRVPEGTEPTDLMGASHPDGSERAIPAFRPDPTAAVPASERDQFRPALAGAAAPTLVNGQADALARADARPS